MRTKSNRPRLARRLAVAALATAVTAGLSLAPAGVAPMASASGSYNRYQHTLVRGDRGTDVKALQYMLASRGFSAGSIDGAFGPATESAVKRFQKAKGFTVDGIVGPVTWTKVHVDTGAGNRGGKNDVKALQLLLDQKTKLSLKVDGRFGPNTRSALERFERMHSLRQDGIITDSEWSKLLGHFEPTNSSLCGSAVVSEANEQWGTAQAVGVIENATANFDVTRHGKPAKEDISKIHGGDIANHVSHEVGLDADFSVFMTNQNQCKYRVTINSRYYDRAATREFIKQLRASGRVKLVYFNDPVLIREGLTRYLGSHDDHFHVRFREHGFRHESFDYR